MPSWPDRPTSGSQGEINMLSNLRVGPRMAREIKTLISGSVEQVEAGSRQVAQEAKPSARWWLP
jgi:hypothetical protein